MTLTLSSQGSREVATRETEKKPPLVELGEEKEDGVLELNAMLHDF